MNEVVEYIVKKQEPKSAILVKAGLISMCAIVFFGLVLTLDQFMLLAFVAAVFIAVMIFRNYNMEYEYIWFDGELQVDKIIAKSSRRKGNTFNFARLEVMAPVGHSSLLRLENGGYKVMDYSANDPELVTYSAFVMCNNELVNLVFNPNEKLVQAIKYANQQKVFTE